MRVRTFARPALVRADKRIIPLHRSVQIETLLRIGSGSWSRRRGAAERPAAAPPVPAAYGVTWMVMLPDRVVEVALTVQVVPDAMPVTVPELSTVAQEGSLDDQVTVAPDTVVPTAFFTTA